MTFKLIGKHLNNFGYTRQEKIVNILIIRLDINSYMYQYRKVDLFWPN